MKSAWIIAFALLSPLLVRAEVIQKFSFKTPQDMTRADLYAVKAQRNPKAVLVLCPGANGNGEGLIRQQEWQKFAREYNLGLVGLSFASDEALLSDCGRGYYCAAKGSGQVLLDGIQRIYGRDIPLLLYGFSGGAHFISGFVEWKPARVISWCAYSAGWWNTPQKASVTPPGIIACGDEDPRYGATMIYFKQGRAAGKPWLWISIPKVGHEIDPSLENFVRRYFAAVLKRPRNEGLWIDIDLKIPATKLVIATQPSLTGWLPDQALFPEWNRIHEP